MKTETPSGQTKSLILELLKSDPQRVYTRAELGQYIDERIEITDGVFAGAVQALKNKGRILKVDRGMYQIAAVGQLPSSNTLSSKILRILQDAEEKIRAEVNGIELLEIEEEDFETIRHIKILVTDLANLRTTFKKSVPAASVQ